MSTTRKSSTRSSSKSASTDTDAVKLLTADHKEVHGLFQKYKKLAAAQAPAEERQALAERICERLTVHATIEEESFYPAARNAGVQGCRKARMDLDAVGAELDARKQALLHDQTQGELA